MKNKILVVALAYPTKDNPYAGVFYKDQVDFLQNEYDMTVVVPKEVRKGLILSPKTDITTEEYTKGIIQYYPVIYVSFLRKVLEGISNFLRKKKSTLPAVGIFRSDFYRNYRKKRAGQIISNLKLDYDLVYCITSQEAAYFAYLLSQKMNKPLVVSEHRPYPHPGWTTVETEWEVLNKADCFFAIGKDKIRQIMLQDIHPKRTVWIGNYLDENKFTISKEEHDVKSLLIIAAHSYFKNYDMFIETVNKLTAKAKNDFRVIVAGYGANKGYAKDAEMLEEKIKASDFADKVELIPEVKRGELCKLYNRADAFVLTSVQEGQPMVCLEAGACGLPIFSTRCGGVEDYVTDEIGRIVDITDSDALSEYLKQFIDGEITFDADMIRKKIVDLFGSDAFMKRIKAEFDRLIDKK